MARVDRFEQTLDELRRLVREASAGRSTRLPPERDLSQRLGIGRRTLRRALAILAAEGHVERHQGRGTFASRLPAADGEGRTTAPAARQAEAGELGLDHLALHTNPLEIMEVRLSIEPTLARLASLRASHCDLARLRELARETELATSSPVYAEADAAFHRGVAEAARNGLMLGLFEAVAALRRDESWHGLGETANCFKRQALYAGHHHRLVEALTARDSGAAQSAMFEHLLDVQQHLLRHAYPALQAAE